uniref:Probable 3-deoxy-D-manno-octulosonic acid transferase, mitochondrial isoform X3 n=1 Tax=Elaeis guineensis var. tenera TaxID=51953 RepID=A0A6I9QKL2_ELAGV|nr:probable 3-deoxy-D-manno-octulosonic acid transferase, mitochondrial isoform X3 [Elaeis guineensis]
MSTGQMAVRGKLAYGLYRVATLAGAPLIYLHLHWRRLRGLEHPSRWPERFGRPSLPRPPGPLLWFHAVSLGEGLAAIPVIKHCVGQHPGFVVLMTTTTTSAFEVIKDRLPNGVIYQLAPVDFPLVVDAFLGYWKPVAVLLMESELWPNLIISASEKGITVALLNARMSSRSLKRWSGPIALPLISFMLSKLSLIVPLSTVEAIRFQLLHASPSIINFAGDLKYAVGDFDILEKEGMKIKDLQLQLAERPTWMAASLHKGEEEGELRMLYRVTPIAVIGGSFLPGLAGHNLSEAAAAGCAVLTGPYIGHFSNMLAEMLQSDCLSVLQVGGNIELFEALEQLLGDVKALGARQEAARRAFSAVSNGVVNRVWNLISHYVLKKTH